MFSTENGEGGWVAEAYRLVPMCIRSINIWLDAFRRQNYKHKGSQKSVFGSQRRWNIPIKIAVASVADTYTCSPAPV